MIRQLALRAAIALTMAVGLAVSVDSAQADLIRNFGAASSYVTYDPELAVSLGLSMLGQNNWYTTKSSVRSGDTTYDFSTYNYATHEHELLMYAAALGVANAGSGAASSLESSSVSATGMLWLYNSNSFDVLLPIKSYHYNYATAYSDAHYTGSAYAIAQNFVEVLNYDVGVSYVAETFYAWARSSGTFGLAGPALSEDEFFYDVRLTPGNNYIVSRVSVDTEGFVSVPSAVPEPGTLTLTALGLISLAGMVACKRRLASESDGSG